MRERERDGSRCSFPTAPPTKHDGIHGLWVVLDQSVVTTTVSKESALIAGESEEEEKEMLFGEEEITATYM